MAHGTSEATSPSPDVLQVQHQIRANAAELQDYFADLYKWEKTITQEEGVRKQTPSSRPAIPLPRTPKDTSVTSTPSPTMAVADKRADAHTYDKGYNKWAKFDVDAALRDADDDQAKTPAGPVAEPAKKIQPGASTTKTTSATIKSQSVSSISSSKSREQIEREDGNEHYKRGDYVAAIKSYTRALGFNSRNVIVLSNRAMAYLKNKEYSKAEDDCTIALKIDDTHVKSYSRRGTARNALGKHRLALLDFERAQQLDPKSKQIASQVMATKELMRSAIKRAASRAQFSIKVVGNPPSQVEAQKRATPTLLDQAEDKENIPHVMNKVSPIVEEIAQPSKNSEQPSVSATNQPVPPIATEVAPMPRPTSSVLLPKLPKKAPASSYEFLRVWKMFALKGDAARVQELLQLRADYLRLLTPSALPSLFKNSIESELLCEIFSTVRQAMDVVGKDNDFVVRLVTVFPRVPRFSMVVMFLSENEKADIAWVVETVVKSEAQGSDLMTKLQALKSQYGLK